MLGGRSTCSFRTGTTISTCGLRASVRTAARPSRRSVVATSACVLAVASAVAAAAGSRGLLVLADRAAGRVLSCSVLSVLTLAPGCGDAMSRLGADRSGGGLAVRLRQPRQRDREPGLPRLAGQLDAAVMSGGHRVDDRQAQPGTAGGPRS